MTIKKNITSFSFLDFVSSNKENFIDTIFNSYDESEEESAFKQCSYEDYAIVLSNASTNTSGDNSRLTPNQAHVVDLGDGINRYAMRIRIDHATNMTSPSSATDMLPNPFEPGISESEREYRIKVHPLAYTLLPAGAGLSYNYGDYVTIIRQRGLLFITRNHAHKFMVPDITRSGEDIIYGAFNPALLMSDQPIIPRISKDKINWTIDEYKMIVNSGCFLKLMTEVGGGESGTAEYDAYNSCWGNVTLKIVKGKKYYSGGVGGGTTNGKTTDKWVAAWGKTLSQMTIQEAGNTQAIAKHINQYKIKGTWFNQPKNQPSGCRSFAIGKYQIIPTTFRGVLKAIRGINHTTDLFDGEMQEAIMIHLLMSKQWWQTGKFLVGQHKDLHQAQRGLAQEWASIPVSRDYTRRDGVTVKQGFSFHFDKGINPSSIMKKWEQKVKKFHGLLAEARKCFIETEGTDNDLVKMTRDRVAADKEAIRIAREEKKKAKKAKKKAKK